MSERNPYSKSSKLSSANDSCTCESLLPSKKLTVRENENMMSIVSSEQSFQVPSDPKSLHLPTDTDRVTVLESKFLPMPLSNNLPIVDRLLSRNLSFTSAEIVTMSELHHAMISSFTVVNGKSVRFIGSVANVDTDNMLLLLSDPSINSSSLHNQYHKGRTSCDHSQITEKHSERNTHGSTLIRNSSEFLLKKRKLISVKNPTGGGILLNKRLSIDQTPTLSDPLTKLIVENQSRNIAMIVVDLTLIPSLCNCTVGDNVMVMGEIHEITSAGATNSRLFHMLQIIYPKSSSSGQQLRMDGEDDQVHVNHDPQYGFVRARILRNSNGVDLSIFEDALILRRKYLREQGALYGTGLARNHFSPIT